MSAARVDRLDPWVGCVIGIEPGVARVLTDQGEVRASFAGALLAAIARDGSEYPEPGDWAVLRNWPDGRVTLEGRWRPARPSARVIPIRGR